MNNRKPENGYKAFAYKQKRGALKPLMSDDEKEKASIKELSYDFACRIVRLFQYLTDPPTQNDTYNIHNGSEYVISKQVYRSGTSIGANVSEAQNAQSKADFLTKMTIASKEANETDYWLNLLHDNGYLNDQQFTSLNTDMKRILHKIIAIVKTTKENIVKQKS